MTDKMQDSFYLITGHSGFIEYTLNKYVIQVGNHSRGQSVGSIYISYNTKV